MLWSNLYPLALFGLLSASSSTVANPLPAAKVNRFQVDAAVHSLFSYYNTTDGRFDTAASWWLTGNALTAVLEWTDKTHSWQYMPQVLHTIQEQKKPLPWWPSGGGIFRADSTDDTGWYALAMLKMFDITRDTKYLDYAVLDAEYLQSFGSSTNELYLSLTAGLANRLQDKTEATKWLNIAKSQYTWFVNSGMINKDHLINDGLTDSCVNNDGDIWSYNVGVILGGLAELYKADARKHEYLALAKRIADAVLAAPAFDSAQGILTDKCEPTSSCNTDEDAFKGIFMRNLDKLNRVLPGAPYAGYIQRQAAWAYSHDRNATDFYGVQWTGPVGQANVGTQGSAVSLLVAAL